MFHFMLKEGDQVGKISEKKLGIYIIYNLSIQCIQCMVYTVHWHCTAFEYEIKETLINKDCKDLD